LLTALTSPSPCSALEENHAHLQIDRLPDGCVEIDEAELATILASRVAQSAPESTEALRQAAYQAEADPLFFKSQRGEATHEDWLAKVAEIKARFPE